jgi:ribosomal protein S18 acetylase RimI-like enzyme
MPEVVRITPSHTAIYKQVRLAALQDSPTAFGSTYARESAFTDDVWLQRSTGLDGPDRTGFIALEANAPCGLVGCYRDEQDTSLAHVISMWVAPSHRGTGLGWTLLSAIDDWARPRQIKTLRLMVTSQNHAAIALYQRFGFTHTGRTEPYPNDSSLVELEMIRPVGHPESSASSNL